MDDACRRLAISLAEWVTFDATFVPEFGNLVRSVYNEVMVGCGKLRESVA